MEEDRYVVGKLKEYHEIFENDPVNNKAQEFSNQAKFISSEFENIKNIIVSWNGQGANTMTQNMIPSIINKLNTVKTNIEDSLLPATEAIENLKTELNNMKIKEQELRDKEKELATEEAKNIKEKIYKHNNDTGRGTYVENPKYAPWIALLESLRQQITTLNNQLEIMKGNCEKYIATIENLENNILNFSFILDGTISLSSDNNTDLDYVFDKIPSDGLLNDEEKMFMTDEEKKKLEELCNQEDLTGAVEYMKYLNNVIPERIYSTSIEERGLTPTEQNFINDHKNDNNMLRILFKGEEIPDNGTIDLKEGETVEIIVKIPTNEGEHIELCRTGLDRDSGTKGKILQSNSVKPNRYKKSEALKDTGYYIWTVTAKEKGKGFHISQTTQYNTENQQYYNSSSGNGAFKEMFNLYINVV